MSRVRIEWVLALLWALVLCVITAFADGVAWNSLIFVVISVAGVGFARLSLRRPPRPRRARRNAPSPNLTRRVGILADHHLRDALAAAPTNRAAAEEGVRALYRESGLAAPGLLVWARSPREMFLMRTLLSRFLTEYAWDPTAGWRGAWVRTVLASIPAAPSPAWWEAARSLRAHIEATEDWPAKWHPRRIRRTFNPEVPTFLAGVRGLRRRQRQLKPIVAPLANTLAPTLDTFRATMFAQLRAEGVRLNAVYSDNRALNHAIALALAYDDAVRTGRTAPHRWLAALSRVDRACHGFWPLNGAAVLCDNPVEVRVDEHRRLHAERGAALRYPDGFAVWAIHGTRLPAELLRNPHRLPFYRVQAEPDANARRLLVEFYGAARYRRAVGQSARRIANEPDRLLARHRLADYGEARFVQCIGQVVDEDIDPSGQPRRLWHAIRRADQRVAMVEVRNSTPDPDGRRAHFWLRVPPHLDTCREAVAWTFGMSAAQYQLGAES
jgi:hypothetical protein